MSICQSCCRSWFACKVSVDGEGHDGPTIADDLVVPSEEARPGELMRDDTSRFGKSSLVNMFKGYAVSNSPLYCLIPFCQESLQQLNIRNHRQICALGVARSKWERDLLNLEEEELGLEDEREVPPLCCIPFFKILTARLIYS
jgi:hypothetical protein